VCCGDRPYWVGLTTAAPGGREGHRDLATHSPGPKPHLALGRAAAHDDQVAITGLGASAAIHETEAMSEAVRPS
jgi:hypothetical protein